MKVFIKKYNSFNVTKMISRAKSWKRKIFSVLGLKNEQILAKVFIGLFSVVIQVMTCRPRSDLYVNLPALRKLDNMLLVRSSDLYWFVKFPPIVVSL